ncbi:17087_t:CDS:2, partial [Gigaspora rosea]
KYYRVELGTRAFLRKVFDAKNSIKWRESKVVQDFEQEVSEEKYNWHLFWSTLKGFTGIRYTTLKKSKKLAFWYKVILMKAIGGNEEAIKSV